MRINIGHVHWAAIAVAAVSAPALAACGSTSAQSFKHADTAPRVRKLIAEHLGIPTARLVPQARIIEDLGADSLDLVEIVMALEEEFGIAIADDDAVALKSVGDAIAYVDRTRAK